MKQSLSCSIMAVNSLCMVSTFYRDLVQALPLLLINHVILEMPQFELRRQRNQRLAMPQQQIPALDQTIVEIRYDDFLRRIVKIDDHVAAEHDVQMAEERDARLVVEIEAAE